MMIPSSRAAALIVAGVVWLAPAAQAQPPGTARHIPGAAFCEPAHVDTAVGAVYGTLHLESPTDTVPSDLLSRVLANLSVALINDTLELEPTEMGGDLVVTAVRMNRPQPLIPSKSLEARPGALLLPWWPGHPALVTEIVFTVDLSGALTAPSLRVRGDSATAAVLLRAMSAVRAVDRRAPASPVRVRLRLSVSPDSTGVSFPLVAGRRIRVAGPQPRVRGRDILPPGYPRSEIGRGTAATVLIWYMVDERGSVVRGTLGATSANRVEDAKRYDSFVKAVTRMAPDWTHSPAEAGGCAVKQRVVVPVAFNVAY